MNLKELKVVLDEMGVSYPSRAKKPDLEALVAKHSVVGEVEVEVQEYKNPANKLVAARIKNGLKEGEKFKVINGVTHVEATFVDGTRHLLDTRLELSRQRRAEKFKQQNV